MTVFIEQVFLKRGIQRHCSSKGPDYSFNSNSYYEEFFFFNIYCGSKMRKYCFTLELSMLASGFSPPLQISHNVVPKLHLSEARLRFLGSRMHSGGTQGIRSTRTTKIFAIHLKININANILIKCGHSSSITMRPVVGLNILHDLHGESKFSHLAEVLFFICSKLWIKLCVKRVKQR